MKMISGMSVLALLLIPMCVYADSYASLLKRYEKQIKQQERQLKGMRARLEEKERDVTRWQSKAQDAKTAWSEASSLLEDARAKIKVVHQKRQDARILADAAQWTTTENILVNRSAVTEARVLAQQLYGQGLVSGKNLSLDQADPEFVLSGIAKLSAASQQKAEQAKKEEAALRTEEMRWQNEEQARAQESDRLHQKQQAQWLKWQEALRRKTALEDEISQIEQSAKALQVMLQEIRDHRNQARALHQNGAVTDKALVSLRGTLPWPAPGKIVQNFGRQYSDGLNQLVISNGIKISAGSGRMVRVIQEGKVLFASPFRQYGQLVIVQHKNALTSVYAGLGQTQVKEGQILSTLDALGTTSETGAFYFELRRDEQPINPLVYLSPIQSSELSSRRKFR